MQMLDKTISRLTLLAVILMLLMYYQGADNLLVAITDSIGRLSLFFTGRNISNIPAPYAGTYAQYVG